MNRFYLLVGGIAVAGLALIGYLVARPKAVSIPANVRVQPSDTAGFAGYVKGVEGAPVEIIEFADYQCPFCQTFATLQLPTIEERLIRTGKVRWRYYDFPLQQHPYARLAAHSAACADDQGKFWAQHDKIYAAQADWSASSNATPLFRRYASEIGLDLSSYDDCMSEGRYAGRIQASAELGVRLGVNSTPTLLIDGRLYQGRFDSDAIARIVDSLTR